MLSFVYSSKAAIEEGVVVGGGCSLLRLSTKVDGIKQLLDNEEQRVHVALYSNLTLANLQIGEY